MEDSHIHPNRISVSAVYKSLLVTTGWLAEKTRKELAQLNPTENVFEASWKDVKTAARKYLGNG